MDNLGNINYKDSDSIQLLWYDVQPHLDGERKR